MLEWPFCLLSCVVDGSPVSRHEKWCCCLSSSLSSCHLSLQLHPSPTHQLPLYPCMKSLLFFLLFILTLSIPLSVSSSLPACLFPPLPYLPSVLSFPAKRLAGVFSTVVTFKTECHRCLSLFLIPPSRSPVSPSAPSFSALASPIPPSSSCSEGLLDQVLCLEERLALIQLSSVCVWAVCVIEETACQVHI